MLIPTLELFLEFHIPMGQGTPVLIHVQPSPPSPFQTHHAQNRLGNIITNIFLREMRRFRDIFGLETQWHPRGEFLGSGCLDLGPLGRIKGNPGINYGGTGEEIGGEGEVCINPIKNSPTCFGFQG